MKGKTFFYDKDYTIVNKTVYTNCQKRMAVLLGC